LIAELLGGELARRLGLLVPEIVFIEMDASLGRSEPNAEIRDLLRSSVGLNLGLRFLPSALSFNPMESPPGPELASAIVWFDAFATNVDRTTRNVNMLVWRDGLWLVDHGATFYVHHDWRDFQLRSRAPFPLVREHCLLAFATELERIDHQMRERLSGDVFHRAVDMVPSIWLGPEKAFKDERQHREAYISYLQGRLDAADIFVQEAVRARAELL
jgi:hypothetical protein